MPQAGAVSPGGAEVASAAREYWNQHLEKGVKLPYFAAFCIHELNIFANMCGTNFVVYRQVGRRGKSDKTRPLQVVADTTLFSTNAFSARRAHIVIADEGCRKLNPGGLRRAKIAQMLPNVSEKNVVTFESPAAVLSGAGKDCPEELKAADFADLRSDVRLLDLFSIELGRPVRLLAINCTTRFRRKEANSPRKVKANTMEQRTSAAGGGPGAEALTLCLQARTSCYEDGSVTIDAVSNLSNEFCGPRMAGHEGVEPAVKKSLVRDVLAEMETPPKKLTPAQKRKVTSHVRLDPCCRRDESVCEACLQYEEEYEEAKRPELESSPFLYHPKKSGASFLAEARSLGICELFPWLEKEVFRLNLMSCSTFDLETLNVPIAPAGTAVGSSATLAFPDEVKGGRSILTKHVPFCVGTSSFKIRAVDKWDVDDLVLRMRKEAGVYKMFRVEETVGVPDQHDVSKMVFKWLEYLEHRRKIVSAVKRKRLAPIATMLRDMAARSDEFLAAEGKKEGERTPAFTFTVYGNLLRKLERFTESLYLVSYNGNRCSAVFSQQRASAEQQR